MPRKKIDDPDNPEWTKQDFARAKKFPGGASLEAATAEVMKPRGRPKSDVKKEVVNLRLDPDVLAHFRAQGDGWQTRINAALRRSAKLGASIKVDIPLRGSASKTQGKRRA
jgi:uncharacterized protein (DUF4415 family)